MVMFPCIAYCHLSTRAQQADARAVQGAGKAQHEAHFHGAEQVARVEPHAHYHHRLGGLGEGEHQYRACGVVDVADECVHRLSPSKAAVTVGASLLAKNPRALRLARTPALSLTTFASKLAPTERRSVPLLEAADVDGFHQLC